MPEEKKIEYLSGRSWKGNSLKSLRMSKEQYWEISFTQKLKLFWFKRFATEILNIDADFVCHFVCGLGDRNLLLLFSTWNWQRHQRTRANWSRLINFRGLEPHVGVHLSARKQTIPTYLAFGWLGSGLWLREICVWSTASLFDVRCWYRYWLMEVLWL